MCVRGTIQKRIWAMKDVCQFIRNGKDLLNKFYIHHYIILKLND